MLREGITAGVTEVEREDFSVVAGERIMELAVDPGMEMPDSRNLHASVYHHATLADTLTSAIRRADDKAWRVAPPETVAGAPWSSSAFLDPTGNKLRRTVMVTAWTDSRHYSELRSWYAMGEMAVYNLPMTQVVLVLGQHRDGRRNSPWTKGFQHPANRKLRFRKKGRSSTEVFSDSWRQIWREDHDEISNHDWLQAMHGDDILRDVCFTVEIPALDQSARSRILQMAQKKVDRLLSLQVSPEPSLSVCDRPPCQFRGCCWSKEPYSPAEGGDFVQINCGAKIKVD